MNRMKTVALCALFVALGALLSTSHAFVLPAPPTGQRQSNNPGARNDRIILAASSSSSSSNGDDDTKDDAWDDDVDYDKEFPADPTFDKSPDPAQPWDELSSAVRGNSLLETGKLGIKVDLGPLSERDADELRAAATELINDAVAAGIDDIEAVRKRMKEQVDEQRQRLALQSEWQSQQAQTKLLDKIDKLTGDFLAGNAASRKSTKLAAAADRSMEGRGAEMGSWGVLGQTEVVMETSGSSSSGGINMASSSSGSGSASATETSSTSSALAAKENRIVIVADTKQDAFAKQLVEPLTEALQQVVSDLVVNVYAPTATLPLGGNNAAAVLLFLTSLTEAASVRKGLERLLRKTMQSDGKVASPPTQIVAISTVGTERTNKMPYSMQNLLGGKLDKRRQLEEAVMNVVNQKFDPPSLDYTICKLGELKPSVSGEFGLKPGDSLDGDLQTDSAVKLLQQAIALQVTARNVTLSSVGGSTGLPSTQQEWDEAFVQMAGPEVWRKELTGTSVEQYDRLIEYLHEWGSLPESSKALTTPIRVELNGPTSPTACVVEQSVMQFLYLPTATGTRYMSKSEERARERDGGGGGTSSSSSISAKTTAKEGGLEIVVEVTRDDKVRVRARRCNYAPGVIIKEMTEETLLGRLKKTLDFWIEHEE